MRIAQTFPIFVYFSADPKTEGLGCKKTETEFKIPQPPNTNLHVFNSSGEEPKLAEHANMDLFFQQL